MLFKPSPNITDTTVIKLKGLNKTASYQVKFQERSAQSTVKSGAELMSKGLAVAGMAGSFVSEIIWLN